MDLVITLGLLLCWGWRMTGRRRSKGVSSSSNAVEHRSVRQLKGGAGGAGLDGRIGGHAVEQLLPSRVSEEMSSPLSTLIQ